MTKPPPGLALDEIVLERLAIAAAILLHHPSAPPAGLGDAALVELVLSAAAGEAERSRALHLLGLRPQAPLTVLAYQAPVPRSVELGDLQRLGFPLATAAGRRRLDLALVLRHLRGTAPR